MAYASFNDEDTAFIENFFRTELLEILSRKYEKKNAVLDKITTANFFGCYVADIGNFRFSPDEKRMIGDIVAYTKTNSDDLDESQRAQILKKWNLAKNWFFDEQAPKSGIAKSDEVQAPTDSINMLTKLLANAKINAHRPKNGYRYDDEIKQFSVYLRTMAGPSAYKTLQANLVGSLPFIYAANQYIHRSSNRIIEGVLRSNELLSYLKERELPLWVSLSEDATAIENRVQYDPHTNQLVGFVLPIDGKTGMPQPLAHKARTAMEMLQNFAIGTPSTVINTIMAQPIGHTAPFCLLVFGSNNKYTSNDVSNRCIHITSELARLGIRVITVSSDSDPKFNSAMRANSKLGHQSPKLLNSDIFKCGLDISDPFYTQDTPHILTKLRNLLYKTIKNSEKFLFGAKHFIKIDHLKTLMENFRKDEHCLTSSCLDPNDRQNVDSAIRICTENVIDMLRMHVPDSDATVLFLQIMADSFASFMATDLCSVPR